MANERCKYLGPNGETCQHDAITEDYCYWHDDTRKKTEPDLVERLEARARTGEPMVGFKLRGADLRGINLVNHHQKTGFQLVHSDLYRCDLRDAHLFHIDMNGTSLMKAKLSHANLNCADLTDVNLLGVQIEHVKIDHTRWDDQIIQEKRAYAAKSKEEKLDFLEQAEEIYRNLRKTTEAQGLFEHAGRFFQREMIMRRHQLPRYSSRRLLSKLVDLFCGYGEEPYRVVLFSLFSIFTFAIIFFLIGITDGSSDIRFSSASPLLENIQNFLYTTYFSVVTFTTLGYGDLAPTGWARSFAAIEAFLGSFTLALFVVVFVKKMTR